LLEVNGLAGNRSAVRIGHAPGDHSTRSKGEVDSFYFLSVSDSYGTARSAVVGLVGDDEDRCYYADYVSSRGDAVKSETAACISGGSSLWRIVRVGPQEDWYAGDGIAGDRDGSGDRARGCTRISGLFLTRLAEAEYGSN
jgi:hypothetical protein